MDKISTPIVFDSGCTVAVTPYKNDVMGPTRPSTRAMNRISSSTPVKGEGEVGWNFVDDYEVTQYAIIKAFLVPASKVRPVSPHTSSNINAGCSI